MGSIIFWGIIRTAVYIPVIWILADYIETRYWWSILVVSIYAIIIQPAVIQYRLFIEANQEIMDNSLCASCNFFDKSAVICLKLDKHPTMSFLPCEGLEWEPKNERSKEKEIDS